MRFVPLVAVVMGLTACREAKTLAPVPDAGPKMPACQSCLTDSDCGDSACAQFGGDAFCTARCTNGSCLDNFACTTLTTVQGEQAQVCVPMVDSCGQIPIPPPPTPGCR